MLCSSHCSYGKRQQNMNSTTLDCQCGPPSPAIYQVYNVGRLLYLIRKQRYHSTSQGTLLDLTGFMCVSQEARGGGLGRDACVFTVCRKRLQPSERGRCGLLNLTWTQGKSLGFRACVSLSLGWEGLFCRGHNSVCLLESWEASNESSPMCKKHLRTPLVS